MKKFEKLQPIIVFSTTISLFGCASVAVTDDAIVDRTAFALGADKCRYVIDNCVNDGMMTPYSVKNNRGDRFNCYASGSNILPGPGDSEAICTKKGEVMKNSRPG